MTSPVASVAQDDVFARSVAELGFAIVPGVVDPTDLATLIESLSGSAVSRSRAGARHLMGLDAVRALASAPALRSLADRVLSTHAHPYRATLFDKSRIANWAVVWHQDTALPLARRHEEPGWGPWSVKEGVIYAHAPTWALSGIVALRIHLDDSTEANGPLRVLPGTHRQGVLADAQVAELARSVPSHACVVGRGGILAMSPMLIHASGKAAQPTAPRRVLHIEYARSLRLYEGVELAPV